MTRPKSDSLFTLGALAGWLLGGGVAVWVVAWLVTMSVANNYNSDAALLGGAVAGMNFGGALVGFGFLALVGYLVAAAVGDFLAHGRAVRDGVDADPSAEHAHADQ